MTAAERARELVAQIDVVLATVAVEASVRLVAELKGATPSSADLRWLRRLIRATERAELSFAATLTRAFLELGAELGHVAAATKDDGDAIRVEMMLARSETRSWARRKLAPAYERHYAVVGEITYGAVSERVDVSIGWDLEDRVARAVVGYGGTRAGLLDISADTRHAIYAALEDGRTAGEGAAALARRIRRYVPAGRFVGLEREREGRGVAYRSTMIARTETTFARNVSALAAGETAGFDRYLVFDARIGRTDAECVALNGTIVDGPAAAELVRREHPNGTRSISPVPRDYEAPKPKPAPPAAPPLPRVQAVAVPPAPPPPTPAPRDRAAPLPARVRELIGEYEKVHRHDPEESVYAVSLDGRLVLQKAGTVKNVPFNAADVVAVRDSVATHNHPSGSAFSKDDYYMLHAGQLYEIRASRNPRGINAPAGRPATIAARLTARTAAMSEADFRYFVEARDADLHAELAGRIVAGKLSVPEANRIHYEMLADRLAAADMIILLREVE